MTNSKLSPNPTVNLGINEMDLFSLEGKNALVTGGGRGIGEMIAGGLLKAGCANVYIASRDVSACERVAAQLNGLGLQGRVHAFKADLTTLDDCKQLVRQIEAVSPGMYLRGIVSHVKCFTCWSTIVGTIGPPNLTITRTQPGTGEPRAKRQSLN